MIKEEWVIDGYNLYRNLPKNILKRGKLSREDLLQLISSFAALENRKVLMVLDGRGKDAELGSYQTASFQAVLSQDISADTYIERHVRESKKSSSMVVVTQDRAICNMARGCGARVFNVNEFCEFLTQADKKQEDILFKQKVRSHRFHRPFEDKLKDRDV